MNETEGGYSGELLHGDFRSFHSNGQLKSQGEFSKGLKQGEWKAWDETGRLTEVEKWSNGRKHGLCKYFTIAGNDPELRTYKHGQIVVSPEEGEKVKGKKHSKTGDRANGNEIRLTRRQKKDGAVEKAIDPKPAGGRTKFKRRLEKGSPSDKKRKDKPDTRSKDNQKKKKDP